MLYEVITEGVIVDKERVHTGMPEVVKDAKVLLLSVPIELTLMH